jgi:hypothetical protein
MIIGTVRAEEAKVFDGSAGYHQFHNEDGEAYGSFEVFWDDADVSEHGGDARNYDKDGEPVQPGWYWASGFPGCMWDGEPSGPFATSHAARYDADEFAPD